MKNQSNYYFVYGLIALAIIGLVATVATNPGELIKTIFGAIASVAIIYFLFKYVFLRSENKNEQTKYKKAVKQSKKLYNGDQKKKEAQPAIKRTSSKSTNGLTVIEGKKKKKDKMFF